MLSRTILANKGNAPEWQKEQQQKRGEKEMLRAGKDGAACGTSERLLILGAHLTQTFFPGRMHDFERPSDRREDEGVVVRQSSGRVVDSVPLLGRQAIL